MAHKTKRDLARLPRLPRLPLTPAQRARKRALLDQLREARAELRAWESSPAGKAARAARRRAGKARHGLWKLGVHFRRRRAYPRRGLGARRAREKAFLEQQSDRVSVRVAYDGAANLEIDRALDAVIRAFGGSPTGSGYSFRLLRCDVFAVFDRAPHEHPRDMARRLACAFSAFMSLRAPATTANTVVADVAVMDVVVHITFISEGA